MPGLTNIAVVVAVKRNAPVPLLKVPELVNDPPTAMVPTGNVVEPLVMVKLRVEVALVSKNVHTPPEPLRVRL